MVGFQTSRSTYYVDSVNHIITGGKLGDKQYRYIDAQIMIGCRASILLDNGKRLVTGTVKNYI